ncbi:MAG: hypothetical protein Q4E76_04180 [Tissierellia bacterium]|nr:hypothetical protein [Tissierellia bacterium]
MGSGGPSPDPHASRQRAADDTAPINPNDYSGQWMGEQRGNEFQRESKSTADKVKIPLLIGASVVLLLALAFLGAQIFLPKGRGKGGGGENTVATVEEQPADMTDGNYRQGIQAYEEGKLLEGAKYLSRVPQDSKNYESAQNYLRQIHDLEVNDLQQLYVDGEYLKVYDATKEFLAIYSDSDVLRGLKDNSFEEIARQKNQALDEKQRELDEQLAAAEATKADAEAELNKAQEARKKAEKEAQKKNTPRYTPWDFIDTTQVVQVSEANVRYGPGLDYGVAYIAYKGYVVYVSDAVADGERVWCYIGDGWISSRTLTGEL